MPGIVGHEFDAFVNRLSFSGTQFGIAFKKQNLKVELKRWDFYRHDFLFPKLFKGFCRICGCDSLTCVTVDFILFFDPFRGKRFDL